MKKTYSTPLMVVSSLCTSDIVTASNPQVSPSLAGDGDQLAPDRIDDPFWE